MGFPYYGDGALNAWLESSWIKCNVTVIAESAKKDWAKVSQISVKSQALAVFLWRF
jgi:hypothetical protein